jgi:Leucine-rich repeat (LRR) protein
MALIVLVCIGFGWLTHRARLQHRAVMAVEAAGGRAYYEWEVSDGMILDPEKEKRIWPRWLVRTLGPDFLGDVRSIDLSVNQEGSDASRVHADDTLLAEVAHLGHLESLFLSGNRDITDGGLLQLRSLRRLRHLELDGTGVRGPGLTYLAGLTQLGTLDLSGIAASDSDLAYLAGLTSLTQLSVAADNLTDEGLRHLAHMTRLVYLQLNSTMTGRITTSGLFYLRDIRHLESLSLWRSQVRSVDPLKTMSLLKTLRLSGAPVDDAGLAGVASLANLTFLELDNTRVGDQGFIRISSLPNLETLVLSGTAITDLGLQNLGHMRCLHVLSLDNTQVADAGLASLAKIQSLRWLGLSKTGITDAGLVHLVGLSACQSIDLTSTRVTTEGITALRRSLPLVSIESD